MFNTKIKNMDIPENLFSNLGEIKSKENPSSESINEEKEDIKMTNYSKHTEYRDRITKMYEDIKDIKPIDNEIDNIIYLNNYIEKGIVVKPKISSLKQFWTEFRLISNEKNLINETKDKIDYSTENFDRLFDALSIRVEEINKYIDELKEMKTSIDITTNKLKEDKEQLKEEKEEFLNFKKEEETKIQEDKENLKINFERLQTIIDDLNNKLGSIEK